MESWLWGMRPVPERGTREPALTPDVVFGVRAAALFEERLQTHLLGARRIGRSSLRQPLSDPSRTAEKGDSP